MYSSGLAIKSACYLHIKDYDAALDYLLQAKSIKNSSIPCEESFYTIRMAHLFYQQKRYTIAANYFKKGVEQRMICKDQPPFSDFAILQENITNIGLCFANAEMYDSASFYYQHALDYITQNGPLYPDKTSYVNITKAVVESYVARIKQKESLYAEAEKMMLNSIDITEGVIADFTLSTQLELAGLYIEWNKLDKAENVLEKLDALHHFRQFPDTLREPNMDWNLHMQKLWAAKRDTIKAFAYNRKYLAFRDSLDLDAGKNIAHDLESDLESKGQQKENVLLEQQKAIRSFQLTIVALLSVIVIGIILFVWNNLRRTARQEKSLQTLNTELQLRSNDLREAYISLKQIQSENATITRMVAHDLKNPIGGIRNLVYSFIKRQQPGEIKATLEDMNTDCNTSIEIINELIKRQPARSKESAEFFQQNKIA